MRKLRALLSALALAPLLALNAHAQSTINTGQPASNSNLSSLVVRQLATAAASDINGILGGHPNAAIGSCPSNPYAFTDCLVTGANPYQWYKWTGAGGYGLVGTINPNTGVIALGINSANLTAASPITVTYPSAGVAQIGIGAPYGLASLTAHSVLLGEGSANIGFATIGTAGRLLVDQGAGLDPAFQACGGDCSSITSGGSFTIGRVNGVAYPASPSTNTVPVVTAPGVVTYEVVPNAALANSSIALGTTSMSLGGNYATIGGAITWTGVQTFNLGLLATGGLQALSNGVAFLGGATNVGAVLAGQGTSNDVTIENKNGVAACGVLTGTTVLSCNQISIAPSANTTNVALAITQSYAGGSSGSPLAGPVSFNTINITDSAWVTGSGRGSFPQAPAATGINVVMTPGTSGGCGGGSCANGRDMNVVQFVLNYNNVLTNIGDRIGEVDGCQQNVNDTNGGCYAGNDWIYVSGSGVVSHAVGRECDMAVQGAAAPTYRTCWRAVGEGSFQGTTGDGVLQIGATSTSGQWLSLVSFSGFWGSGTAPLASTASFFTQESTLTTWTVANIFNLPNLTVTGNILSFPNVTLTGGGNLTIAGSSCVGACDGILSAGNLNVHTAIYVDGVAAQISIAGQSCTLMGSCSLVSVTNTLASGVSLSNTANYFDGPSITQGTTGTWQVKGSVLVYDTAGAALIYCKLWDGTTVFASGGVTTAAANSQATISLSASAASPAANLRISCRDTTSTSGIMAANASGLSKDSTISATRTF